MDRDELLKRLELSDSTNENEHDSTEKPGSGETDIDAAVARVVLKSKGNEKVYRKDRGLTKKQKRFVELIVSGKTKVEAYQDAYNPTSTNKNSLNAAAHNVWRHPRVQKELKKHEPKIAERIIDDAVQLRRYVLEKLFDRSQQAKTENAELRALELMGKAVGLFGERQENGAVSVDAARLKADLENHLASIDNVIPLAKLTR